MLRIQPPSNVRIACAAAVLATCAAGAFVASRSILPSEGALARGLQVAGEAVLDGQSAQAVAEHRAARALERKVTFRYGDREALTTTLADLGATIDVEMLARRAAEIGHEGDLTSRLVEALDARAGRIDLRVPVTIGAETLAAKLERFKEENDSHPVDARLDFDKHTATEDAPGKYADIYAAVSALDRALLEHPSGDVTVEIPSFAIAPRATKAAVLAIDVSQEVSRFETKFGFVGGQANRAGNVKRASSQIDGVVLMPGEIVSFNEHVGPRSTDNGFFPAPEIYKGEMREGIGGGTCEVAGTLHAAAFFAGLHGDPH